MFKKAKAPPPSANYAFASANDSSAQVRQKEQETFYRPLPANTSAPTTPDLSTHSTNPYSNPFDNSNTANANNSAAGIQQRRDFISRTPSPSRNTRKPLLSGEGMATNRAVRGVQAQGGLPSRGESQNPLLAGGGDARQTSAARRYGPTASNAPIGANAALLGSPSGSSNERQPFAQDAAGWGTGADDFAPEADDYLHNPDPKRDRKNDRGGTIFTARGLSNIGCLIVLIICLITLFAGYPIISHYTQDTPTTNGAYNLGGINSTGQIPLISNFPTLIDTDTPSSASTRQGFDGETYNLVWSDEFNKDGRTFFPGDDPYWTAIDFHYWPTDDFEWYDPSAITTRDGNLVITMTQEDIHDLNFKSGMLQSWNQLCFQYSIYVEVSVSLPGVPQVGGFWPGIWLMGNLGRPGYGATTEGTWPYTYDSCDLGTLPNQTNAAGTGPAATLDNNGNVLSFMPGQRMSACTCSGEDHAGPNTGVGRSAPEVDILEGQINLAIPRGQVSQSMQVAPFDAGYQFNNASPAVTQYNTDLTMWNSYLGGQYQQAISSLTYFDTDYYVGTNGDFNVYGMELYTDPNDRTGGHITWVSSGVESWTLTPAAIGPNAETEIGQRLLPEEPMALVINFGMSNNFQTVNFADLAFPAEMHIDYIRVYQRSDGRMGCDPADHPTADYIANHANAYNNANLTTWEAAGYTFPKNSLKDTC